MRHSHLGKLMLILVGLVCVLQLASYFSSRLLIRDTLLEKGKQELAIAGEVFGELLQNRSAQLLSSVEMLAADTGFRQAVASQDTDTIQTALQQQSQRIGADLASLIDSNGLLITLNQHDQRHLPPLELLHGKVRIALIDGVPYELVLAPLYSPDLIGWITMGFAINEGLAWHLAQLTSLDVSFITHDTPPFIASTLLPEQSAQTAHWLATSQPNPGLQQVWIAGEGFLLTTLPLGDQVTAILQLPIDTVLGPFYALSRQLMLLSLGGLTLALLAASLLARGISKPVQALANASRRISSGHYNTVVPVRSDDEFGDLARAFNTMQGAIAEREQRLVHQAEHDSLTGLANRRMALLSLEQAIKAGSPFAVMALDLNRFKEINDSLGHGVGDQVLGVIARRLDSSTKERDLASRLGADEFLLLISGVDTAQSIKVAHRLRERVSQTIELEDLHLNVEAGIGIALYPEHGEEADTLMRRADIAMYDAKQAGHQVAVYQDGWDERHLRRLSLARDLKESLNTDALHLLYQPKAALRDRERIGAEALIRWHHPTLGPLRPDEFIAIAEDAGHINRLTRWVLKTAIKQLHAWHSQHLMVQLSVNISADDLLDEELPGYIATLLANAEIEPQALCLEITESSVMKDEQQGHAMLARLKGIGLRLAVDDFGTGYSSLSQLKRMPVDELKIDKSFVLNLDHSDDDAVIVHSTIELGHNMGLEVVAEGVENRDALMLLESFGCDMIQGFLLGKPMSATELAVWARAWLAQPRIGDHTLSA
jgi:diguanylate cyclase (GGDEF)-like protein